MCSRRNARINPTEKFHMDKPSYRFHALESAIELASVIAPHIKRLERREKSLAEQLRRAVTSAASCLAEGNRRVGKDRIHLFRTAEGSAAEVHTQLRIAVALGAIGNDDAKAAIELADRVAAMCFGLTRVKGT
jgi:four helix bundle protein